MVYFACFILIHMAKWKFLLLLKSFLSMTYFVSEIDIEGNGTAEHEEAEGDNQSDDDNDLMPAEAVYGE